MYKIIFTNESFYNIYVYSNSNIKFKFYKKSYIFITRILLIKFVKR